MKALLKDYRELGIRSINMKTILNKHGNYKEEANLLRDYIHKFGFAFIDTPWYNEEDVQKSQCLYKKYFTHRDANKDLGKKDSRPEHNHLRGWFDGNMYENQEENEFCFSNPVIKRFFNKIENGSDVFGSFDAFNDQYGFISTFRNNEILNDEYFKSKNYPGNVSPQDFPDLLPTMRKVSLVMEKTGDAVLDALSLSMGLEEKDSIKKFTKYGDHYTQNLCTLNIHEKPVGNVISKLHFDRELLTVHTRSNYPCLILYTTEEKSRRIVAKPPPGSLCVQAGLQLEWLTGGYFASGFHEVIVTEEAKEKAIESVKNGGDGHRISQTTFIRCENETMVGPYDKIKDFHLKDYPFKMTNFENNWKDTENYKRI